MSLNARKYSGEVAVAARRLGMTANAERCRTSVDVLEHIAYCLATAQDDEEDEDDHDHDHDLACRSWPHP
jgi:hypothetical protein